MPDISDTDFTDDEQTTGEGFFGVGRSIAGVRSARRDDVSGTECSIIIIIVIVIIIIITITFRSHFGSSHFGSKLRGPPRGPLVLGLMAKPGRWL